MTPKIGAKGKKNTRGSKRAIHTAGFDEEFVADTFSPPTPKAKAKWRRAKRKRGRPIEGDGATVISVSIERTLLTRCDKLAKKMRLPAPA